MARYTVKNFELTKIQQIACYNYKLCITISYNVMFNVQCPNFLLIIMPTYYNLQLMELTILTNGKILNNELNFHKHQ